MTGNKSALNYRRSKDTLKSLTETALPRFGKQSILSGRRGQIRMKKWTKHVR